MRSFLIQRREQGDLLDIDVYFAEFMSDIAGTSDPQLVNVFAELSHAQLNQHACLDMSGRGEVLQKLRSLDCLTVVTPQDNDIVTTPLVLSGDTEGYPKLYLQRYHQYESNIARQFIARNEYINDGDGYVDILNLLFPPENNNPGNIDYQKIAAFQCLTRRLTVITGGPGTGKTSTVVRILAALMSKEPDLKVKLAAPTGKAAARLGASISSTLSALPGELGHNVPTDVSTIHRLLGMRGDGHSFKYDTQNRIPVDLLILDEVSMIDLAMFDRILNAIPGDTRLILLGDPDQLASVDNGAVLSDLCKLGVNYDGAFTDLINSNLSIELPITPDVMPHKLTNAFCHLTRSYRFSEHAGIGALSTSIRRKQVPEFADNEQVKFVAQYTQDSLVGDMLHQYQPYTSLMQSKAPAEQLMDAFERCRILSPLRDGPLGVNALNNRLEEAMHSVLSVNGLPDINGPTTYYHGKPIIITRNDYNLRLFNGDIGICVLNESDDLVVAFMREDHKIDYYLASRLPPFETCFVMTVHKAQGSEFDQVSLVLPEDLNGVEELASRNLIYTGITRTSAHVTIYADPEVLNRCLQTSSTRLGGLTERFLVPRDTKPDPGKSAPDKSTYKESTYKESTYKANQQLDLFDM